MIEEWRDVLNFEGLYQVSNLGRVKKLAYNRVSKDNRHFKFPEHILKGSTEKYSKYRTVELTDSGGKEHYFYIHRLVAEAFISNPNSLPEVSHIDGDKENNVISNLEWSTRQANIAHSITTGLGAGGGHKIQRRVVRLDNYTVYDSIGQCCKDLGVCYSTVYSHIQRHSPLRGILLKFEGDT